MTSGRRPRDDLILLTLLPTLFPHLIRNRDVSRLDVDTVRLVPDIRIGTTEETTARLVCYSIRWRETRYATLASQPGSDPETQQRTQSVSTAVPGAHMGRSLFGCSFLMIAFARLLPAAPFFHSCDTQSTEPEDAHTQ